jgi:hypothetical protein
MPHIVCLESGFYKGVKVIATKADRLVLRNQRRQTQEARKSKASEQAPSEKE